MKRLSNIFVVLFALAAMPSCYQDEIVYVPAPTVGADYICFNVNPHWANEDEISRSGADCNRLGMHTAKSADGSVSLPIGVYEQNGIFTTGAETRGAKFDNAEAIKDMGMQVWANYTVDDATTLFFPADGENFTWDEGTNCYVSTANQYPWPGAGTIDFVAITNAPANSFTANLNSAGTAVESLTYTVPTDPTKQNDIVIATPSVDGNRTESYPLEFKHVLSAIQVKVGTIPSGTIKSMAFKNIYNTIVYDCTTKSWTRGGTKDNFPVLSNGSAEFTPGNSGSVVNSGEYTLMLAPQTLPDDAILEIVFQYDGSNEVTLSASIAKDKNGAYYQWKSGITTYYTISIDENYNLQVIPQGNVLDAHYIMTTATVKVTELGDNLEWYLKVSAENVTSVENITVKKDDDSISSYIREGYWINSIDGNIEAARGTQEIKGSNTGETDVIIFIPENITASDRKITLEYGIVGQEAKAKKEYLYQKAPFWDASNNWGWEKVDDQNSGTYGFEWTRKVCYMFSYRIKSGLTGSYTEQEIRNFINPIIEEYNASEYVTLDTFQHYEWDRKYLVLGSYDWIEKGKRMCVIIDYTKLKLDGASSPTDGFSNTKYFFDARSLMAFEEAIKAAKKPKQGETDQTVFRMLETNIPKNGATQSEYTSGKWQFDNYTYLDENGQQSKKMFRELGENDDASGILKYIIMRNAYNINTHTLGSGDQTTMLEMNAEKIKWYLPAYEQFTNLENFEFATGDATFTAADFWSSTAAPNNQAYTGAGVPIDRNKRRKVIVQRFVDGGPAAVTIDNTSMAGGDNGEAQWAN